MTDLAALESALRKADALAQRGDQQAAADAKVIADEIRRQRAYSETGAEQMRTRGLSSPDPSAANAEAERGMAKAYVDEHPLATRVHAFNQGLPFIGEYVDEGMGALMGPEARDQVRQGTNALRMAYPGQSAALNVAGGITGSLAALPAGLAAAGATRMAPAASMVGRSAQGLAAGTGIGAFEGAVSGYGQEGDRGENALTRMLIGGGLGGVVGGAAPLAAAGLRNALGRLKGSDVATIADELGVSPESARVIRDTLLSDDLAAGARNIGRGGPDAMIAEAGSGTRAMADVVAQSPGPGRRIITDAVDDRAAQAAGRLSGAMDQTLGAAEGRGSISEGIRRATQGVRKQTYDAAYAAPIDYSSAAGRRIEDIVARAPQATLQRAVRAANDQMRYQGLPNQIMLRADGTLEKMPSAVELDYIKRGFDDVVRDGTDAVTGKLTSEANLARQVSRDLRAAHAAANPAYRKALQTAGDSLSLESAVETGYGALKTSTTPEAVRNGMKGASAPVRDAAKRGVRSYLDDTLANARTVLSDPGRTEDVAEAMKAINAISTRASRIKLHAIMGRDADTLLREIDEARTAFELRASLAQNSKTAPRQALQGSIAGATEPGVIGTLRRGKPMQAAERLVQVLTGATKDMQELRRQGIYEEIARALTTKRGPEAQRALQVINRAMQGQPVKEAEARAVARALAAGTALTAHQTGMQLLGR